MTSYGYGPGYPTGPGYSTGPAYSPGPAYSTGPGYSTGPAYTTGSNGVRPYTNEWGQKRHGSPPGGNYGYAVTGDNRSSRPLSPPQQTFEPGRTYGGYPNQSGYNGPPGYGDYSDQHSTNKPYKHSNTARYDNYDDYSQNRKHNGGAMGAAINMIANGSGHSAKPNRGSLLAAALPARGDGRLSMPTDDMERALHYLKETSKPKNKYSYK